MHTSIRSCREAYTQETQNLIRKQKYEIDQLEKEKKELHKDLRLAESRSNQVADEGNAEKLKSIVDARGNAGGRNIEKIDT